MLESCWQQFIDLAYYTSDFLYFFRIVAYFAWCIREVMLWKSPVTSLFSEVTGDSFLSSSASSFISSLISTTAAIVFIPAIVAVLAVMVVVVEIRVEALFLLILEEARTSV